jgi:uncharacterized protein (DUF1499 family)
MLPLRSKVRRKVVGRIVLAAALIIMEVTMPFSAKAGSRLAPCPDSPNCVSSLVQHGRQAIAPLLMRRSPDQSLECLKTIVGSMKRARIVTVNEDFLHAEFSSLLGFVDDVAFEIDRPQNVIHLRSASRLGYWDLGVNRRRLERIRAAFEKECGSGCG